MENCTMIEVESVLGEYLLDPYSLSFWESDEDESMDIRRLLPNAQIYTYDYNGRMQLSRETAPNGISTYYDYDSLGRLVKTYYLKNNEENILKQYDYRYYSGKGSIQ